MNNLTPDELTAILTKKAEPDDDPSNYNVPDPRKPVRRLVEDKIVPVVGTAAGLGISAVKALANTQYNERLKHVS